MRISPSVSRRFNASRMGDLLMPSWVERNSSVRREFSSSRPSRMYSLMLLYASVVRLLGIFSFFITATYYFRYQTEIRKLAFSRPRGCPDPQKFAVRQTGDYPPE